MDEAVIIVITLGLVTERMFAEWQHARERRYLINAAIAKTPDELRKLEAPQPSRRQPKPAPDDGFEGQIGI